MNIGTAPETKSLLGGAVGGAGFDPVGEVDW